MNSSARGSTLSATLLLTGLLFAPTLTAAPSPDDRNFDQRWYLGAGLGASRLDPEPRSSSMTIGDKNSTSASFRFFGRDITKNYSVEGHFGSLGEAGVDFLGTRVGEIEYTVAGISAVRYLSNSRGAEGPDEFDDEGLYRREGLSFYARVGLGVLDNSSELDHDTKNRVHLMGGLGGEYGWSNGFGVRLEATAYDTDARTVSLELLKRLGSASPYIAAATSAAVPLLGNEQDDRTPLPLPTPAAPPIVSLPNVLFDFDKSEISEAYADELRSLARLLKDSPGLRVVIEGHTDYIGTEAYNQGLSVRRARAVVEYLFSQGVSLDQLEIRGFGESRPVADNTTPVGRAQNRRVDVVRQ